MRKRRQKSGTHIAETLETRVLLAAAVVENKVLTITGTNSSESLFVLQKNGEIFVAAAKSTGLIDIKSGSKSLKSLSLANCNKIVVKALGGNDTVRGDSGNFTGYVSLTRNLEVYGGDGNDVLWGSGGVDYVYGEAGNDELHGNTSRDYLYGGSGDDTLRGGSGNDYLDGGFGYDVLDGGADIDEVSYGFFAGPIDANLATGIVKFPGNGTRVDTLSSVENLTGTNGNDVIRGNSLANSLNGGGGNDWIYGGDGADYLYGGDGNDHLFGEIGIDTLLGGNNNDWLDGGEGVDQVSGGAGLDTFRRYLTKGGFGLSSEFQSTIDKQKTDTGETKDDNGQDVDDPQQVAGAFLIDSSPPTVDSYLHIDQQASPVCTFMASLAAVANWTGRFPDAGTVNRDLISRIGYDRSTGLYSVPLYVAGKWQNITVDGFWTEQVMAGGPMWTSLYLKAYLKANAINIWDSAGRLIDSAQWKSSTGQPWQVATHALKMISGYSTGFYSSVGASAQDFSDKLDAGRIYVASSKSTTSWPIVSNHSYAVLDVLKINGAWYVELYNPWATDAPAKTGSGKVAVTEINEGKFLVTWSDYLKNFDGQSRNNN
ncbi:MAG: C2 family cysteine protease [Planctomycetales bacterium]|nr:C2 family cysteine protease [Planctomycetales bacterium]